MRIKLFDRQEPNQLISDRLVEQVTEFNAGPKHKHDGPLGIELNLRDKADCEKAIEYLGKLVLNLPLENVKDKKPKTQKKLEALLSDDKPLEDLKTNLLLHENQEDLIKALREYDFRFVNYTQLLDMTKEKPGAIEIPSKYADWQFMVRLVKLAKDPKNDKWDTRLIFAIKVRGEKVNRVITFLWGKFDTKTKMPWKVDKVINFKKKERLLTFEPFMDYDMRSKFRTEYRKYDLHIESGKPKEEFIFSAFFNKWAPYVKVQD